MDCGIARDLSESYGVCLQHNAWYEAVARTLCFIAGVLVLRMMHAVYDGRCSAN